MATNYAEAKQLTRSLVPHIVQLKQLGEVFGNLAVTLGGVEYPIDDLAKPNQPWAYKPATPNTGKPPAGIGLMRIGATTTT